MIGLSKGSLNSTTGSILTATSVTEVKTILLFNENTTAETVRIFLVTNNSGSLGNATVRDLIFFKALTPNETFEISLAYPIRLDAVNDSIQGSSTTTNKVNYLILGRSNV